MPFDLPIDYVLGLLAWVACGAVSFLVVIALRRYVRRTLPRRVLWLNAALSLWMFLAALTVVELYFAVIYDQSDSYNMSNVSKHWFARHVRRNEFGFRDDHEFPEKVPEGRRRICFVGDSFTFGHGVKDVADRFSDRIAGRLDTARPGKFVVSNIAETAWEVWDVTDAVEAIVVNRGRRIDVLVYTVCLNDIEVYEPASADEHARLGLHAPQFLPLRDTYFLNMLYFRVRQAQLPEVRNYYSQLAASYGSAPWQRMQRKLDELREFCRDRSIDLRIVIFPFLHNLGPEYPFDAAHEQLGEYFRRAGVPCLDLKPLLTAHASEGLTVNRFDAHPNERAHALAAEAIERELLGNLFVSEQP
jgi:hypothetical protein